MTTIDRMVFNHIPMNYFATFECFQFEHRSEHVSDSKSIVDFVYFSLFELLKLSENTSFCFFLEKIRFKKICFENERFKKTMVSFLDHSNHCIQYENEVKN